MDGHTPTTVIGRREFTMCLITATLLVAGCTTGPTEQGAGRKDAHWIDWGVFLPDDHAESSKLRTVTQMAGSSPKYVLRFAGIEERTPIPELNQITEAGATPILTLEPWKPGLGPDQPDYSLWRITAGQFDGQLDTWARNLAEWNQPVIVRFGHEMNSDHYPWSVGVNGNTAADFVAAWKYVRGRFEFAGADKVSFMWCPDAPYEGSGDMSVAFPGTDAVDVLGLDGYNWGDGQGHSWKNPEDIFKAGLEQLRGLDGEHPIIVGETASVEGPRSGTDKAQWIRQLFGYLSTEDRVSALVWFQMVKERDWRLNSSAEAQAAFNQAVASRPTP